MRHWRMHLTALGALAAAAVWGGDEQAAGKPKKAKLADVSPEQVFTALDKNHDGVIDESEVPPKLRSRVKLIDADGDRKISKEEFESALHKIDRASKRSKKSARPEKSKKSDLEGRGGALFSRLDADGDERLDAGEMEKAPPVVQRILRTADRDGDGVVSKQEFATASRDREAKMKKGPPDGKPGEPAGKPEKPGKPQKKAAKGAPGEFGRRPDAAVIFRIADKNGDGKISRDEAPERLAAFFDKIDLDGDGALSEKELKAMIDAMPRPRSKDGKGAGPSGFGPPNLFGGARTPRMQFDELDKDADGRLTRAEAAGAIAREFDRLDADGDGKLDLREVENGLGQEPAAKDAKKAKKAKKGPI